MSSPSNGKGIITAEVRKSDGAFIATELYATYPLRLHLTSRPNNNSNYHLSHEQDKKEYKALCCYMIGYGGGLISGDSISLEINVREGASLVVTSQSTSKAFKQIEGRKPTFIKTNISLKGNDSLLVYVPQPTQCFQGSVLRQDTCIDINTNSSPSTSQNSSPSLVFVDWYTGGGRQHDIDENGSWFFNQFSSSTTIHFHTKDKKSLVFRDSIVLSGGKQLQSHMNHFNVVCMVVLIGKKVQKEAQELLERYSSRNSYEQQQQQDNSGKDEGEEKRDDFHYEGLNNSNNDETLISCGTFDMDGSDGKQQGVVLRMASQNMEQIADFLSKHLGTLNGQLEDDPFLEILVSRQKYYNSNNASTSTSAKNGAIPERRSRHNNMSNTFYSGRNLHSDEEHSYSNEIMNKSFDYLFPPNEKEERKIAINPNNNNDINKNNESNNIAIYQLVDASTPTGGFAHSNTVEVAHQLNFITMPTTTGSSCASLEEYIWIALLQSFTSQQPFLTRAYHLFSSFHHYNQSDNIMKKILDEWEQLDLTLGKTLNSHVSRRASCAQGSGLLRAFLNFPSSNNGNNLQKTLKSIKRIISKNSLTSETNSGHAATILGAICGLLLSSSSDEKQVLEIFVYQNCRDMMNASVRMNLIGPLEGTRLIYIICSQFNSLVLNEIMKKDENIQRRDPMESAHQISPLIEILANAHDRLYTRLFNS